MKRRNLVAVISGVVLFGLMIAGISTILLFKLNAAHASNGLQSMRRANGAATTINNLNRISVVGSTAFIVDGHGRTISVDPNPYGVAVVPGGMSTSMAPGSLKPGDVVVTDFGANST